MQALISIVLPVFAILATGYFCGQRNLLGPESSEALNLFVYWVALPALLFKAMAEIELELVFNWAFIGSFAAALLVTWTLTSLAGRLLFKLGAAECALHGLNGAYANTGYMGIPLAIAAYGQAAALPAILATVISVLSVALAVAPMEMARQARADLPGMIGTVTSALGRNPMIIAPCAGLLWAWSGLGLPAPVETYLVILGAAAGPCALFSIGLYLVGKPVSEGTAEIAVMTASKLVLHPLATALAVFVLIPVDPLWAAVAVLSAALPVGSGPFVLAQAYGTYVRRTSTVMLVTTVLSIFTVSALFLAFPRIG